MPVTHGKFVEDFIVHYGMPVIGGESLKGTALQGKDIGINFSSGKRTADHVGVCFFSVPRYPCIWMLMLMTQSECMPKFMNNRIFEIGRGKFGSQGHGRRLGVAGNRVGTDS